MFWDSLQYKKGFKIKFKILLLCFLLFQQHKSTQAMQKKFQPIETINHQQRIKNDLSKLFLKQEYCYPSKEKRYLIVGEKIKSQTGIRTRYEFFDMLKPINAHIRENMKYKTETVAALKQLIQEKKKVSVFFFIKNKNTYETNKDIKSLGNIFHECVRHNLKSLLQVITSKNILNLYAEKKVDPFKQNNWSNGTTPLGIAHDGNLAELIINPISHMLIKAQWYLNKKTKELHKK